MKPNFCQVNNLDEDHIPDTGLGQTGQMVFSSRTLGIYSLL
jgi:hypothetical protein